MAVGVLGVVVALLAGCSSSSSGMHGSGLLAFGCPSVHSLAESAEVVMTGKVTDHTTKGAVHLNIPASDSAVAATMPGLSEAARVAAGEWRTVDVTTWVAAKQVAQQAKPKTVDVIVNPNADYSPDLATGDHVLLFLIPWATDGPGTGAPHYGIGCEYMGAFHRSGTDDSIWTRYKANLPPDATHTISVAQVTAALPSLGTNIPPVLQANLPHQGSVSSSAPTTS